MEISLSIHICRISLLFNFVAWLPPIKKSTRYSRSPTPFYHTGFYYGGPFTYIFFPIWIINPFLVFNDSRPIDIDWSLVQRKYRMSVCLSVCLSLSDQIRASLPENHAEPSKSNISRWKLNYYCLLSLYHSKYKIWDIICFQNGVRMEISVAHRLSSDLSLWTGSTRRFGVQDGYIQNPETVHRWVFSGLRGILKIFVALPCLWFNYKILSFAHHSFNSCDFFKFNRYPKR
jgi:hypothetical protein